MYGNKGLWVSKEDMENIRVAVIEWFTYGSKELVDHTKKIIEELNEFCILQKVSVGELINFNRKGRPSINENVSSHTDRSYS